MMELKSELSMSTEQLAKIKETEMTLRSQLASAQQVYVCVSQNAVATLLYSYIHVN